MRDHLGDDPHAVVAWLVVAVAVLSCALLALLLRGVVCLLRP